jgi:hypothetical protein
MIVSPWIPHSPSERRSLILCVYEVMKPSATLALIFNRMITTPLIVEGTFRHLLGLADADGQLPWQRVGQPPTAGEMMRLMQTPPCTCGIDPRVLCAAHPCKCAKCTDGVSASCMWRQWALENLAKNVLITGTLEDLLAGCKDSMTYIQVLEAYGGEGPASARERNLLNITALLPSMQPIRSTNGIVDRSKRIGAGGLRSDGTVGTMLTGSTMWSVADGD